MPDHTAAGAGSPHSGAAVSAAHISPPASLGAPAHADDEAGGLDLAQGGLTWSGDLDLPGGLDCPSLAAGLHLVSAQIAYFFSLVFARHHRLLSPAHTCCTACRLPTTCQLGSPWLRPSSPQYKMQASLIMPGSGGPGLRDRLELLGSPIAAHHGPANAVATASVAGDAMAYCVGQTGHAAHLHADGHSGVQPDGCQTCVARCRA